MVSLQIKLVAIFDAQKERSAIFEESSELELFYYVIVVAFVERHVYSVPIVVRLVERRIVVTYFGSRFINKE